MMTEFKVGGWWREEEAAGAASSLLSRHAAGNEFLNPPWAIQVKAETEDGIVRIICDDLTTEQVATLREYFENHPKQDMPEWERAKLVAEKARREELVARIAKVTDSAEVSLVPGDVRDALGAVAELAGVDVWTANDAK